MAQPSCVSGSGAGWHGSQGWPLYGKFLGHPTPTIMNDTTYYDQLGEHFHNLDALRNAIALTLQTLQYTLDAADAEIKSVRTLIEGERPGGQA